MNNRLGFSTIVAGLWLAQQKSFLSLSLYLSLSKFTLLLSSQQQEVRTAAVHSAFLL